MQVTTPTHDLRSGSSTGAPRGARIWTWSITAAYALVATLWIYFSDQALGFLLSDPEMLVQWSVFKGLGFVFVTSVLLWFLMRQAFSRLELSYNTLAEQTRQLKKHEVEIARLRDLYAALSQINQAIVFSKNRENLFTQVCETLVGHGKLRLAWVGRYDAESHRILPVAVSGDEEGYLSGIEIYGDHRPEGCGPTGTAFRTGEAYISNDILQDDVTLPWRPAALKMGFRACASFPILLNHEPWGTLSVYAGEVGFFQQREVALLKEAAFDLSFALDQFAHREDRARAESMAESERRFSETMFNSLPGILYFYDFNGHFLRWNQNFETASGYSAKEIKEMQPLDFFSADFKPLVEQKISDVFASGESSIEAPFLAKDSTSCPYFLTGRRVDYEGRTCLVGVGIDVSERKQAELDLLESEQRHRTTLDNILEGCQLLDFDWRYIYLNSAAEKHNRRRKKQLLGHRMPEAWPGIDQTEVFSMLERCMNERISLHMESEFQFPDGGVGWFDVLGQPASEGLYILSIDITERHKAEKALRDLNNSLERKVEERTSELQTALVRAEAADRLKSAFLATMSHELRTPLNSIIGFTGIVLQGLAGPLNPEQQKQLGMVRGSAKHLLELINDVLDLSKIEAGQLVVRSEPFKLGEVVDRVTETIRVLAENKGLALAMHSNVSDTVVHSDRRRVEQILLNLLNNAVKFTDRGGITLRVESAEDFQFEPNGVPSAAIRFRIEDTGIGIQAEDLKTLFLPFRQIDTGLTRLHEGTGLGLAICRRLAELLCGNISVESIHLKGSAFTLTLPLSPKGSKS